MQSVIFYFLNITFVKNITNCKQNKTDCLRFSKVIPLR